MFTKKAIKVFYWSPHTSNVATINNVINSAYSLIRYGKNKYLVSIIDSIGEWSFSKENILKKKIDYKKIGSINLSSYYPFEGYLLSRLVSILIFLTNFKSLKKILLTDKPHYLIIHLATSLPLFLLIFFKFETKFILRISGLPRLNFLRKILWKYSSRKLHLVTCPSAETKNYLSQMKIFPKNKIIVLLDPILNVSEIINKKKQRNDLIYKKKYFLSIGRLTKQKNHLFLVNFFSSIIKNNNDYLLYIIGEGEQRLKLLEKINELNLKDRVFLLGHKKNIFQYIKNADAVFSTSLWEDPGAVMVESAFCNTIIISSDCTSGPKEFIEDNKAGYLFENNSQESLLKVFSQYTNDKEEKIMSKKFFAKKKCKHYTIFSHYHQICNLLL